MAANIIGLGGLKRSGKDTVADWLVENHGYVKVGMSDILHDCMMALNPLISATERYADIIARLGYVGAKGESAEVRELLQRFGTEVGRNILGQNVWVDAIDRRVSTIAVMENRPVVITGIRFKNELEIVRIGNAYWVERGLESDDTHDSENSISASDFEATIYNTASIEALHQTLSQMAREGRF